MDFGNSFLPNSGWTLTNATMDAGTISLGAGGLATITLDSINSTNLLPEAMLLRVVAGSFTSKYAPTLFARIHILYDDENTYEALAPIIDTDAGEFKAQLTPSISNFEINVGAFVSVTVSFFSSEAVDLTVWELCKSNNDVLITDVEYFGITISTQNGLKITRSDGLGEATFNSLAFSMRAMVNGVMTDKIYFDPAKGTYVFDGELSADIINALSVLISPNLYAGKATISELTVDQLDTSDAVQKYLVSDLTPDNFQRIYDQYHEFITASVTGTYGAAVTSSGEWTDEQTDIYYPNMTVDPATGELSATGGQSSTAAVAYAAGRYYRVIDITSYYKTTALDGSTVSYDVYTVSVDAGATVQATNRDNEPLYWTDETHVAASATVTAYPVYTYIYTEQSKMKLGFDLDPGGSGFHIPMISFGVGSGTGNNGKGFIYKGLSGLYLDYYRPSDGALRRIILGDDGIVLTPYALESLDFYGNGFSAVYSGETVALTWTLNPDGTIATLVTPDNVTIPVTWHMGDM